MDAGEVWSEVDSVFILVILKVVPQVVVEGDRVGFLSIRRGEDKEVISLFVSRIVGRDVGNAGVSGLS